MAIEKNPVFTPGFNHFTVRFRQLEQQVQLGLQEPELLEHHHLYRFQS